MLHMKTINAVLAHVYIQGYFSNDIRMNKLLTVKVLVASFVYLTQAMNISSDRCWLHQSQHMATL